MGTCPGKTPDNLSMTKDSKLIAAIEQSETEEKAAKKRLILPHRKTAVELQMTPDLLTPDQALADALQVISIDIARYRNKVTRKGESLELSESRVLQGHIKALVEMKRELREQERMDDLSKLSETELFALAKKALANIPAIPEAEVVESPDDEQD